MWIGALADCLTHGGRIGDTTEIQGVAYRLTDPSANAVVHRIRRPKLGYACAELGWYLSGSDKLEHLVPHAPSYGKFSDDGITLNGAYGPRGLSMQSLDQVAQALSSNPSSRQVVVPIWRESDRDKATKDMPCTVSLQFLLRNGLLSLHVYMRSNDLHLGFLYDTFCFTSIQQIVADMLKVGLGVYTHHVGSLHIYDRNLALLTSCVDVPTATFNTEMTRRRGLTLVDAVINGAYPADLDSKPVPSVFESMLKEMKNADRRRS